MQSDVFPYRANRVVFVLANLAFVASWLSLCVHLIRRCFNDEMGRPRRVGHIFRRDKRGCATSRAFREVAR